MKELILPIISMIVGLTSLFVDSKKKGNRRIFVFFILLVAGVTIFFNLKETAAKRTALEASQNKEKNLQIILMNITANTDKIPNLVNLLKDWGFNDSTAKLATPAQIEKVISANKAVNKSLQGFDRLKASTVKVQYFLKDVDGEVVKQALKSAGFSDLEIKNPINDVPTNSIWVGDSVSQDETRIIALTLSRAGVTLKSVKRFQNGGGAKSHLVQIGSDPNLMDKPGLDIQTISNLNL